MRRYSILIAASILFGSGANAAEPTLEAKAALTNLKRLVARTEADPRLELKKVQGLKKLGFAAKEEVLGAQLTDPVQVYMVRLDKLREYRPGADNPANLLGRVDAQIYPLRVNTRAKASVFIDRGQLSGYGSPQLTRMVDKIRNQLLEQTRLPLSAFFLVKIPALNARFIGHYQSSALKATALAPRTLSKSAYATKSLLSQRSVLSSRLSAYQPTLVRTKRLMLTPLHQIKLPVGGREDRYASLAAGKTLDADQVLRTVQPAARNLDVSVPN